MKWSLGIATAFVLLGGCASGGSPAAGESPLDRAAERAECSWQTPLDPQAPGSPQNPIPSDINPNGDSELAALMRGMESDVKASRAALLDGKLPPPGQWNPGRLPCSWPSAANTRSATFDAFSMAYVAAWDQLQHARELSAARAAYDTVVSGCVACHSQYCQGPISRIERLRLGSGAE